jgi:hypothetical protein
MYLELLLRDSDLSARSIRLVLHGLHDLRVSFEDHG